MRINELATNLWWSWHEDGRQVFRSLDYAQWRASGHNPVKQIRDLSRDKLEAAARDPAFLELYDSVMDNFDAYLSGQNTRYSQLHPGQFDSQIAYFSAEYAIHNSLPIYAGGLGVLAGDMCKEASDLGLPFIAVGFMYPQGYFRQRISADGWQQEEYSQLNFNEAPISRCAFQQGRGEVASIQLADRPLLFSVWKVNVGRVTLYLLDTNVEENSPEDRTLSARLYTAAPEERMRQLIVLGVGGVRALRLLGIDPSVWHANEDHTALMMLERLREEVQKGTSLQSAIEAIRAQTVFTTHTPIAAGHNLFSVQLMEKYASNFWGSLGIDKEVLLELGRYPGLEPEKFSLTACALRLSGQANAVSKLHGRVTRQMWHSLWPGRQEDEVPISVVTNGVHLPTWQAPEIAELCRKHSAHEFPQREDDPAFWQCVPGIPDEEFWQARQVLKTRLIRLIQDLAQQRWVEGTATPQQVVAMGSLLDPYALTIAFARRFTEYKRPLLIFSDLDRLKKIVTDPLKPVQLIFAGKSHPADYSSKQLLNRVSLLAMDRSFQGRIAFVEDYDMTLSRELARGVDVWLNNPRRLQEACGTSGMKASLNGVLNLSVRDGWWDEGFNQRNGWAIGPAKISNSNEDATDAEALYGLLEKEVVPMYYDRDRIGVPHHWIEFSKEAIRTVSPGFSSRRMVGEYAEKLYIPASQHAASV